MMRLSGLAPLGLSFWTFTLELSCSFGGCCRTGVFSGSELTFFIQRFSAWSSVFCDCCDCKKLFPELIALTEMGMAARAAASENCAFCSLFAFAFFLGGFLSPIALLFRMLKFFLFAISSIFMSRESPIGRLRDAEIFDGSIVMFDMRRFIACVTLHVDARSDSVVIGLGGSAFVKILVERFNAAASERLSLACFIGGEMLFLKSDLEFEFGDVLLVCVNDTNLLALGGGVGVTVRSNELANLETTGKFIALICPPLDLGGGVFFFCCCTFGLVLSTEFVICAGLETSVAVTVDVIFTGVLRPDTGFFTSST